MAKTIKPAKDGKTKKILIVEDEQTLLKVLTAKLIDGGYKVISAIDGQRGVEAAQKNLPDLILLDILLPVMDGFHVLKKLKADPVTKKIPVLILSNLGQESEVQQGKDLGANDYLIKTNFRLEEILAKIKGLIDGK